MNLMNATFIWIKPFFLTGQRLCVHNYFLFVLKIPGSIRADQTQQKGI